MVPGTATMAAATLLTAHDLLAVPNPGLPHELWRGALRVVMPASGAHGSAVSRLTVRLGQYVYAHDLGELFSESTGFLLEKDPDTLLCPDLAFVAKARLPRSGRDDSHAPHEADQITALGSPFPEIAPDLAVEVLSAGDRPRAVWAKVVLYLRLGVRRVWVFDPAARRVQVHSPGRGSGKRIETAQLGEGDSLDGGEILPGFRCPLSELFGVPRMPHGGDRGA